MTQAGETVVCRAKKDLPIRWFIAAAIFIGFGCWCYYDGYVVKTVTKADTVKPDGSMDLNKTFTYYMQNVGGIALPILGLIPLGCGIRILRRKLIADENGIGYAGKQVPWSNITKVDDSQLANRAVLRLHYDQNGQDKQLVLAQMDLENFKPLVAMVQAKVIR